MGIYDSNLCKKFLTEFSNEEVIEIQNINRFIDNETIVIDKIYYRLAVPSRIVDSSEIDDILRRQSIKQNEFNVSLISLYRENNGKRGFESRATTYRKRTRNRPSTLIIGAPTQNEIVYVTPVISVLGQGLSLEFNYIISKPMAFTVFSDITQSPLMEKINHILTGYFYVFLTRIQLDTILFNVVETLNSLDRKNYTPSVRNQNYTPSVRNPRPLIGDRSFTWLNKASRGILNIMEKNMGKQEYRNEMVSLFYKQGSMIPNLIETVEYENLATTLNEQVVNKVNPTKQEIILLEEPEKQGVFFFFGGIENSSPEDLLTTIEKSFFITQESEMYMFERNLNMYKKMFSDPAKNLPDNILYGNEVLFWEAISLWNTQQEE